MKKGQSTKLLLPVDNKYLRVALNHVIHTADMFGAPPIIQKNIELACEEALINIIEHGEQFDENETLEIECKHLPDGMEIIIKEKGIPYDPQKGMVFNPGNTPELISTQGLGLFLMIHFMDDVIFRNLGADGLETRLIKKWNTIDEKDIQTQEDELPKDISIATPRSLPDFKIRKAEPDDAIEIIRGVYRTHGYTLYDSTFYDPEKLAADIAGGRLFSAIAVCPDGKVVGHAAFLFHRPGEMITEATYAFVDPDLRSSGILSKVIEFSLIRLSEMLPLKGIFQYSVANHIYSQKTAARNGSKDCGIMLATSQDSWKFKGIANDENQSRITNVIGFVTIENSKRTVFLPEKHSNIIQKIYRELGLERDFSKPDTKNLILNGQSVIDIERIENEKSSEISIISYGTDILFEIRRNLRILCIDNKFSAIHIKLSLENPTTAALVPEIEKMGFFFCGILPMTAIGDTLILQYLNNVKVDYSNIKIFSETGKELLAYIRSCDPWAALDSMD